MKTLTSIELYVVAGGWVLFFLVFLTRPRGARGSWMASDRRSLAGMVLQIAALAIVRGGLRTPGTGFVGAGLGVEITAAAVAFALLSVDRWVMGIFAHATHFVLLPALRTMAPAPLDALEPQTAGSSCRSAPRRRGVDEATWCLLPAARDCDRFVG